MCGPLHVFCMFMVTVVLVDALLVRLFSVIAFVWCVSGLLWYVFGIVYVTCVYCLYVVALRVLRLPFLLYY